MLIALEALKDCGMLRVNRIQLRRMLCQLRLDKLTADHKRAKNPAQRNEVYAKLHKAKNELAALQ